MNLVLPALAWLVYAALALPIVIVVGASLTAGGYLQFPPDGLSLRWWRAMAADPDMANGFLISGRVALLTLCLSTAIGALAAIQLGRMTPRRRNALAAAFSAPLSVPLILTGFSLLVFFTQVGLLNEAGLVIGHTVVSVPYVLRATLASLSLSDHGLPRAAAVHGATPRQVIWHVMLPILRPGLVSGGLFAFLASVNNIVVSVFVAQPGISPLPVVIFSRMENLAEPTVAAASTAVVGATALLCLLLEKRYALFASIAGR